MEISYIAKDTGFAWKNETEQLSKMLAALIKSRSTRRQYGPLNWERRVSRKYWTLATKRPIY